MRRHSGVTRSASVALAIVSWLSVGCSVEPGLLLSDSVAMASAPTSSTPSPSSPPPPKPPPTDSSSMTIDPQAFWLTPGQELDPIDSSLLVDGPFESRGVFSILLLGDFGAWANRGQAVCTGDGSLGPPEVRGDPMTLFNELVVVTGSVTPVLERRGAAPYRVATGQSQDPVLEGEAWVSRSRGMSLSEQDSVPAGVNRATYLRPFDGLDTTDRIDVVVTWRCDSIDPNRTPPPKPTPRPTPVCPPPAEAPIADIIPRLVLFDRSHEIEGDPASITFEDCVGAGGDSSPWITPDQGITISGANSFLVRLISEGVLFDAGYRAAYMDAADPYGPSEPRPLGIEPGPDANTLEVKTPPPGDWSVSVFVGVNDTVHGVIFTHPYYFRVRVTN